MAAASLRRDAASPRHARPRAGERPGQLLTHVHPADLAGLGRVDLAAREAPLDKKRSLDKIHVIPLEPEGFARTEARPRQQEEERIEPPMLGLPSRLQERGELLGRHRPDLLQALGLGEGVDALAPSPAHLERRVGRDDPVVDSVAEKDREDRADHPDRVLAEPVGALAGEEVLDQASMEGTYLHTPERWQDVPGERVGVGREGAGLDVRRDVPEPALGVRRERHLAIDRRRRGLAAFADLLGEEVLGDRRKMAQVIDLFREEDTRDELGLGVVRDALADLLFPGTSTIQTRARYFLFVPWIYRRHEEKGMAVADVARKARSDEDKLIEALVQGGERPIGVDKRTALQRPARSIYWAGLSTWRIRCFQGSQDQYHRAWDALMRRRREALVDDDGELVDRSASVTWDPELPEAPTEFLKLASFALTRQEAEYLQHRILGLGATLLGYLVGKTKPAEDAEFAWTHPAAESFPPPFRGQVEHARLFSEAMHGAALL